MIPLKSSLMKQAVSFESLTEAWLRGYLKDKGNIGWEKGHTTDFSLATAYCLGGGEGRDS